MKTFVQSVKPSIVELEVAGESYFDSQPAAIHAIERGPLASVHRRLLEEGVVRAFYTPHEHGPDNPDHKHRLWVSSGSGGSASGSNEALDLLLDELRPKTDNVRKLAESGADQRHLFVWINDDTPFGIARPPSHQSPSGAEDGWGLPLDQPALDPAITHLWVTRGRDQAGFGMESGGESCRQVRAERRLRSRPYALRSQIRVPP